MAVAVSCALLPHGSWYSPRPVYVGFMVGKVALGEILLHFCFFLDHSTIAPYSAIHLIVTDSYMSLAVDIFIK
jgi:hypothetical protein